VRDSSGAFVAGATVRVKNEKTGEVRAVLSNDQGFFAASPLKPSTYTITAEKPGFSIVEYPQMPLAVGRNSRSIRVQAGRRAGERYGRSHRAGSRHQFRRASVRQSANARCRTCRSTGGRCQQLMLQAPGSQKRR
jgi:hypothetical protein